MSSVDDSCKHAERTRQLLISPQGQESKEVSGAQHRIAITPVPSTEKRPGDFP